MKFNDKHHKVPRKLRTGDNMVISMFENNKSALNRMGVTLDVTHEQFQAWRFPRAEQEEVEETASEETAVAAANAVLGLANH